MESRRRPRLRPRASRFRPRPSRPMHTQVTELNNGVYDGGGDQGRNRVDEGVKENPIKEPSTERTNEPTIESTIVPSLLLRSSSLCLATWTKRSSKTTQQAVKQTSK